MKIYVRYEDYGAEDYFRRNINITRTKRNLVKADFTSNLI